MNTKKLIDKANRLQKIVISFLNNYFLQSHQTLIIGLSGGPDSIALLHLLKNLTAKFNFKLIAAHLDHEWRTNSHQDVLFCKAVCKKLDVEFISQKASELNTKVKSNGSQEEVGRKLRQCFFTQIRAKYSAKHIILAHHFDDQIETFMMRLIRGSSPIGLGCIPAQNKAYLRPLLAISKTEIINYLNEYDLAYITDPTNEDNLFLRNRIRKLVPGLKKCDSRFERNFARTLSQIQQTNSFVTDLAKEHLAQITDQDKLNLKKFFILKPFLQKQIILQWLYLNKVEFTQSEKFINEISRFFSSTQGGTHQIHHSWQIIKKQNLVAINKSNAKILTG
jgi:tRNA(Ile)-lysidine synthase